MPIARKKPQKKSPELSLVKGGGINSSKYQILFDQASDAILTLHADGKIDEFNHAFEELVGWLKPELEGQSLSVLVPNSKEHHLPARSRSISKELFTSPGVYEDIAVLRKDGYVKLVDLSVRLVQSGKNPLILALFRDVTEKKKMERELITKHSELRNAYTQLEKRNLELKAMQESLVQAGKMAALGELAAGIAHELNQPLQGIRGYAQELEQLALPVLKDTPVMEASQSSVTEIISNVDKMVKIIQYLRSFTRKSVEELEEVDVHQAIEEALKMLSRQFSARGIEVIRDFDPKLPQVYANPLQVEQVIINLATNARDAIEATKRGSGKIQIQTRVQGQFIEIRFTDNGMGMNERTKSKIFNPFFTTKEVGSGMGLGLSLSFGMMSKIQGTMRVESELGKGTTFIVQIPIDFRELG